MDSICLVPWLSGIPFSLANGRHHQEIGEKEKKERCSGITPGPFLPGLAAPASFCRRPQLLSATPLQLQVSGKSPLLQALVLEW